MKKVALLALLQAVGVWACQGNFYGELETDTEVEKRHRPDDASNEYLRVDNDLPKDCQNGDLLCVDDDVILCLWGRWTTLMNCWEEDAVCSNESGTPMCVKTVPSSLDAEKYGEQDAYAISDTSEEGIDTIVEAATSCLISDEACFNASDYPCTPEEAAPEQLDCSTWAIQYGPCTNEVAVCNADADCVVLQNCISNAMNYSYSERILPLCFQGVETTAVDKYFAIEQCTFCTACSLSCDGNFPTTECTPPPM